MATQYAFTDFAEAKLLTYLFKGQGKVYLALYTTTPTEDDPGVEIPTEGTGYSRQEVTFGDPFQDSSSTKMYIANTNTLTFGPALVDWGTVTGGALIDAGGHMIVYGDLATPQAITTGNVMEFGPGSIEVSLD